MSTVSQADAERRARFEAIAGEVFEPLQRYLRRRASRDDAADVLGTSLLTVWRRLDEVPTDAPLPWCYGVARRTLANHRRGAERHLRLTDRLATLPPTTSPDPGDAVDEGDPELHAAIATLSDSEAEIVRLWAWEGLEPREIAIVAGSTANAVSVALARAKRKLRDRLDDRARRQYPPPTGHKVCDSPAGAEQGSER
ncbi:MAG TPA: sigma-70 family RNA polymerase sigma factor [Ilumatobacter sp.]|nr:sigma-70 family RNA polymerase sigma factor [Ilumatobacter sp.]